MTKDNKNHKLKINGDKKLRENIEYKELTIDDINNNLLDSFNRYQEVEKCYRQENGNWIIKDIKYIDNWDKRKIKISRIKYFIHAIKNGGCVFGAYDSNKLIGFAVLLNKKFGTKNQYIELKYLHVSLEYRNKGIGKKLFGLCIEKTEKMEVEKIYVSANSAEETQKFYLGIGFKDAEEINSELAENEPYDRQMEYKI